MVLGFTGRIGSPGLPGAAGNRGFRGLMGDQGPDGRTGPSGETGDRGRPGADGRPGPAGTEGIAEGYVVVRHSQDYTIPQCPNSYKLLWEGYSMLYTVGNGHSHGQDLSDAGSCVRKFRYDEYDDFLRSSI